MFHKAKSLSDSKALTLSLYALLQNHFKEFQELTSKFEWTLDDIRIEKIISDLIWATIFFFFDGFSPTRCETLPQAAILCNIKEN